MPKREGKTEEQADVQMGGENRQQAEELGRQWGRQKSWAGGEGGDGGIIRKDHRTGW